MSSLHNTGATVRGLRASTAPPAQSASEVVARLLHDPIGAVGAAVIAATVLIATLGPTVWAIDPTSIAYRRLLAPDGTHPMGTDELGRDTLARIIHGAQVSFEVGGLAVFMAVVLGGTIGVLSAYYGGFTDALLMRVVDILFAIPALVLAIMIAGLLGPSRTNAVIAIGIVYAPAFARVARGSSLSVLALPYVEAARAVGAPHLRLMTRHLIPNIATPLIVLTTVYLSAAILTEAALSFLGLGIQPPEPSWGSMLSGSRAYMVLAPWLAIFPGLAIMVIVLGFNFLGDGLRDILDPRMRDA